jgi:hypothetical protein
MFLISSTANMLADTIKKYELTQREIADRAAFKNANIISMRETDEARIPLDRIPSRAQTLGGRTPVPYDCDRGVSPDVH